MSAFSIIAWGLVVIAFCGGAVWILAVCWNIRRGHEITKAMNDPWRNLAPGCTDADYDPEWRDEYGRTRKQALREEEMERQADAERDERNNPI